MQISCLVFILSKLVLTTETELGLRKPMVTVETNSSIKTTKFPASPLIIHFNIKSSSNLDALLVHIWRALLARFSKNIGRNHRQDYDNESKPEKETIHADDSVSTPHV